MVSVTLAITCSAVLAACNSIGLTATIDIVLSYSRLYDDIISALKSKIYSLTSFTQEVVMVVFCALYFEYDFA